MLRGGVRHLVYDVNALPLHTEKENSYCNKSNKNKSNAYWELD